MPLCLLTAMLILLLAPAPAPAMDIVEAEAVVRDALIYPRTCKVRLPAALPAQELDERADATALELAVAMEKAGLLSLDREDGATRIRPNPDEYDLLLRQTDLNYMLVSVLLVLGEVDVTVQTVEDGHDDSVLARGEKVLVSHTRLFKQAEAILAKAGYGVCGLGPTKWRMTNPDGDPDVQEESLGRTPSW